MDPKEDIENDADVLVRWRKAAIDTAVQQLRLIHELKGKPPVAGVSGPHAPGAAPSECPPPKKPPTDLPGLLFDMARLSLLNYEQWVKLSGKHFDFIADALRRLGGREPRVSRLALNGKGAAGETSSLRFVIENPLTQRADVSFTAVALKAADNPTPLSGSFTGVLPGTTPTLEPRQSGSFELSIPVGPGAKAALYTGESSVVVGGQVVGVLCITFEVR